MTQNPKNKQKQNMSKRLKIGPKTNIKITKKKHLKNRKASETRTHNHKKYMSNIFCFSHFLALTQRFSQLLLRYFILSPHAIFILNRNHVSWILPVARGRACRGQVPGYWLRCSTGTVRLARDLCGVVCASVVSRWLWLVREVSFQLWILLWLLLNGRDEMDTHISWLYPKTWWRRSNAIWFQGKLRPQRYMQRRNNSDDVCATKNAQLQLCPAYTRIYMYIISPVDLLMTSPHLPTPHAVLWCMHTTQPSWFV